MQTTVVRETGVAGTYLARESVRRHGAERAPARRSVSSVQWCHGHRCRAQRTVWWPRGAQRPPAGTSATFLRTGRNKLKI